jgi:hypothetical protein
MDGATFWNAVAAVGTCAATVVAILTYRHSRRPPTNPDSSIRPATIPPATQIPAEPAPLDFELELNSGSSASDRRTVRGTTPGRRGPRDLDLELRDGAVLFYMHPPGKMTGARFRIPMAELRAATATGLRVWTDSRSGKEITVRLHQDLPEEVGPEEVRLDGDWWIYVPRADLRSSLAAIGVSVDW